MITIKLGYGNALAAAFDASAKTVTITVLYNCDITIGSIKSIYNTTRSAYMYGGNETPPTTGTPSGVVTSSISTGVPIFTLTLNSLPASSANGDSLIILLDMPDDIALFNAMTFIGVSV